MQGGAKLHSKISKKGAIVINYYKELGVKTNASKEEIKLAYLSMLKKYHPDIYDGNPKVAQDKTALLNECYSVLKDDEKRQIYDQKLFASQQKKPDDYILREFFRRFSTNRTTNKQNTNQSTQNKKTQQAKSNKQPTQKSQTEKKSKKQKKEKQTLVHQKSIEYSLDEQQERRENKRLTIYIIIILSVIIGIILASLLIK